MRAEPHELAKLRASDNDRQRIADVIGDAYADGRLTIAEHSERLEKVWASKTLGELEPLIADLGRPVSPTQPQQPTQSAVQTWQTALPILADLDTATGERTLVVMSENNREGEWMVQPKHTVFALMGSAKWDLREAVFTSMTIELNISAVMGSVELWLPAGVGFIDKTTHIMGATNQKGMAPADPRAPVVIVKGFTCMGSLEVYGPNHRTLSQKLGIAK
ncbi:MAG: DUF1707 domain-containing protein [Propionibacteriaceae bacterium]|nr:DUF1707 domain-containing protein [Propionibacteriaceae bacterium]